MRAPNLPELFLPLWLVALALAACTGPAGPAGPPGMPALTPDAAPGQPDAAPVRDASPTPDATPIPDAGPTPDASPTPDATPTPDAAPECPPWSPPAGLGGPAHGGLGPDIAQSWLDFHAARTLERAREALDPAPTHARLRLEQAQIADGCVPAPDLIDLGRALFARHFTREEGFGHALDGGAPPLRRLQRGAFGGPDARGCEDCHWKGGAAGAGDRADNAFLYGDGDDIETHDARNPPPLWGAGWVEILATEMTTELHAHARQLAEQARDTGAPQTGALTAKGVHFGRLTVRPDGEWDPSEVVGVDPDLVVKPFGAKGTEATLRESVIRAYHRHHTLQAEELVAQPPPDLDLGGARAPAQPGAQADDDPDGDGHRRELTEGQITAVAAFIATLDTPVFAAPAEGVDFGLPLSGDFEPSPAPDFAVRWADGHGLFRALGCADCHRPYLEVDDPTWRTLAPLTRHTLELDLSAEAARPHPPQDPHGRWLIPLFSDLKRHDLGPRLASRHVERGVPTTHYLTRRLWGLAQTAPYLHDGSATTYDEAIAAHGHPESEAHQAAQAYAQLTDHEKGSLRVYLTGLTRAPAIRVR